MSKPWFQSEPSLVQEIEADLRARYPNLHLFISDRQGAQVRGAYPVISPRGRVLDRYLVAIELPARYPRDLPVVREVGERIPWRREHHVNGDGTACVLLPDDRWRCFPEGARFKDFLDGPVHDFFLGQSIVALGGDWPFGEWNHGEDGVYEFYEALIGTKDRRIVHAFLRILGKLMFKLHWKCPCGSGRKIRNCCEPKIRDLRRKVSPATARKSAIRLGAVASPHRASS